jgi:hypothetical protein
LTQAEVSNLAAHLDGLTTGGLVPAQYQTGGIGFCDQFSGFVGDFAFDVADSTAALNNAAFSAQQNLTNRAQKINFEFDGSEGFAGRESGGESDAHRGVGNVAEDATVHSAHRVKMPGAGLKNDHDVASAGFRDFKSN